MLGYTDVVVLGLPRGGVAVAFEVARALHAPLDVIVVRKIGVPFQPELAMGAIGEDGALVLERGVIGMAGISDAQLAAVERQERTELERQVLRFRLSRDRISAAGRTVVVVDDGIATGSTARTACRVTRAQGAARVVLAVPVAAPGQVESLADEADQVVCLKTPEPFFAVGEWYSNFSQLSDQQVVDLLERSRSGEAPPRRV